MADMRTLIKRLCGSPEKPPAAPAGTAVEDAARLHAKDRLRHGKPAEALAVITPVLGTAVKHGTFATAARICLSLGRAEEARKHITRAITLDAGVPQNLELLADLHEHQGEQGKEADARFALVDCDIGQASATTLLRAVRAWSIALKGGQATGQQDIARRAYQFEGARPPPTQAEKLEFAQWLFHAGEETSALRLWDTAHPAPPGFSDQTMAWASLDDPVFLPYLRWIVGSGSAWDSGMRGESLPSIAVLRDVAVLPGVQWSPWLVDDKVVARELITRPLRRREQEPTMSFQLGGPETLRVRLPCDSAHHAGSALLIGGLPQYYHFTIEHLPRLLIAEAAGMMSPEVALVVNDDLAPFQLEQLKILGYGESRLVRLAAHAAMRFDELVVPLPPASGGKFVAPCVPELLRKRFGVGSSDSTGLKLYLSRSATGTRSVANEEAVVSALRPLGFQRVSPELLSVAQQVELFSKASMIVGATGAALTNMVFSPPGATVVALYNRWTILRKNTDVYFDILAQACNHRFDMLLCDAAQPGGSDRMMNGELLVDIDDLMSAVETPGG